MLRAALLALTIALPLAGCQSQATPTSPLAASVGPERPQSEPACTAAGGRWEKGGLAGIAQCFLDYPDAGKPCQGPADCAGMCLVPADGPPRCQKTYPLFGCVRFLDAEGNRAGICID
ncbi:hypothetical protein [Azospirillum sp. ST 5-10]|uniref:hypothetical protein n=1 Tax=unclassified Azospirillum TaxID=2630922 RepID=UPI003F4A4C0C